MKSTPVNFRGAGLVFVASDVNAFGHPIYERLRHAIYSARMRNKWGDHGEEIYVINVGLTGEQARTLRRENVRVVNVLHDHTDPPRYPLRQKFCYKIWADRFIPLADPIIVADCDLEFGDGALDELLALARGRDRGTEGPRDQGKFFIAEEVYRWLSNLNVFIEARNPDPEKQAYVMDLLPALHELPILNAGLFGGPRAVFDRIMHWCRLMLPGLLDVWHWFWEQMALSHVCRQPEFAHAVEILPTEWNWLTHWGMNPEARVLHFSGEELSEFRNGIPEEYLKARDLGTEGPRDQGAKMGGVLGIRT